MHNLLITEYLLKIYEKKNCMIYNFFFSLLFLNYLIDCILFAFTYFCSFIIFSTLIQKEYLLF